MLKRCFGVLLVICMLFTMTQPIMVTAADDGTLVVGNGTVAAGDTETVIPITVKKTGTVGAISLQFDVVFPEELILTEKPVVGTLFADKGLHQAVFTSPYTISLGNDTATENVTAEGDLFTLNFKVKEGTPAGTYNIEINSDSQDNYNADVDNVVFGVTNGAITVGSPTQGEPEQFTVTFDVNGGTPTIDPVKVDKDATVSAPTATLTKTGFTFDGWFTDANTTTKFDFATPITADTTLYAGWTAVTPEQFTVTFDVNGGTPTIDPVKVNKDATVSAPTTTLTKTGFTFDGWFTDANATTKFDFATPITADTTVYAGWTKVEQPTTATEGLIVGNGSVNAGDADTVIDITIEKKGTTGAAALQFDVVFPKELILTEKPVVGTLFADKGLHQAVFTSPYTISLGNDTATEDTTGEGVLVTLKFKVKSGAGEGTYPITIQGQDNYNANVDSVTFSVTPGAITVGSGSTPTQQFTVTFDANGGTGSMDAAKVEQGQKLTLPTNGFTAPTGKQFKAWDVNGTDYQPNAQVDITADTTVKAIWEDIPAVTSYTVTFDANGGTGSMDAAKVEQGQKLTLPANGFTAPTGKQFKAWDVNGTDYQPNAQVDITADTTVKAIWEDIPAVTSYTVTFDANGGSGSMDAMKAEPGKKLTLPANGFTAPTGKQFKAWDVNGTQVQPNAQVDITADTTVKAVWEDIPAVTYTVTFDGNGGTLATTTATVKAGETVSKPADPTRTGYNFTGWFTAKNGSTKFDFATPITANTTIYAGWEKKSSGGTTDTPSTGGNGGCYIATSVYGSYDAPEVWTLRRFRDDVLGQTWYGRLFIKAYYATSPTLVRLFGDAEWFQNFWRDKLDTLVQNLQDDGFESTPYQDKDW